jgi:hypothetical protein
LAELLMQLSTYLSRALAEPFVWGERDCALWAAEWVRLRRGVDLGAVWRGRYSTAAGCHRLLARRGGMVGALSAQMAQAGFSVAAAPVPGDVGIVATPVGPAVAIKTARGWAWKGKGLTIAPLPQLIAWSV